jgi:hypothetical protein
MKRRIVILLTFLLLGAIVNVAVAWGCVSMKSRLLGPDADGWNSGDGLHWPADVPNGWPAPNEHQWIFDVGTRDDWLMHLETTEVSDAGDEWMLYRHQAGWPSASLAAVLWRHWSGNELVQESLDWLTGIPTHREARISMTLPVVPLWPGFAINTLFYAVILWLLFATPFALRRRLRRKRGLCPACAYPIGTSDVCTECGRSILGGMLR